MKQPYNTALYMRLSRDDESFGDSVSIETQRTILRRFASENNLHVVDEYIDDGWSGTNFDRPNFQRMMADVEAGKVNCIASKDLSRFGREHIMMDYYLEFVFPEKGIRYIAVSDNEDTEKGLSDFVPFKNLFNEWFAKDTSRKVKNSLHAKFLAGERTFAYAPLGYKRDPEVKNRLVIDEGTRWIVEKIFDLAFHGAGAAKITGILLDEQVPTPGWLNYTRYGTFANIYADAPEKKRCAWTIAQVKSIIRNETYIGNSVHGMQTNISFKNKKKVRKPSEKWLRVENTHEAIISREVFEQVQEQIANRRRKIKNAPATQIFSGLVKCADCGWSMSFATNKSVSKPFSYFNCTSYRQHGPKHSDCTSHYIRYDTLYAYVLSRLQYWSAQADVGVEHLKGQLLHANDREQQRMARTREAELKRAQKRQKELDRLFAKLYEDWAAERITEYNFNALSEKYQTEQAEVLAKIERLQAELASEQQATVGIDQWIGLIHQYAHPEELTAEMLNALVEKITVHEKTIGEDGEKEQTVDIYYRFVGKID